MTIEQFFAAGYALYGERWQRSLARALGLNERTVRWWLEADDGRRLPANLSDRLDAVFEQRIGELLAAQKGLPKKSKAA